MHSRSTTAKISLSNWISFNKLDTQVFPNIKLLLIIIIISIRLIYNTEILVKSIDKAITN